MHRRSIEPRRDQAEGTRALGERSLPGGRTSNCWGGSRRRYGQAVVRRAEELFEADDGRSVSGMAIAIGQRQHDASTGHRLVTDVLVDAAVVVVVTLQRLAIRRVLNLLLLAREPIDARRIDAKEGHR